MLWRNWNPCSLLIGLQNGAETMENCIDMPQKMKNKFPCDKAIPLLGIYLKE